MKMRNRLLLALALIAIAGKARAQICLPLKSLEVTSAFGNRIHPITGAYCFHAGIDLRAHHDTVYSVLNGIVVQTGYDQLLGVFITIYNGPYHFIYGHLSQCFVSENDTVSANRAIGVSGATGRVTGEHLHFAVQFNGRYIDPLAFLSAAYHQIINP